MELQQERSNSKLIYQLIGGQFILLMLLGLATILSKLGIHDLHVYYTASLNLMQGKLPYRDFDLEYPPLSLLAFTLPRLVTFGYPIIIHIYVFLFMLENILSCTAIAVLLVQITPLWQSQRRKILGMVFYLLFVVIISPVMLWRYDLFPTLLTILALVSVILNRPTLAGIFTGLGVAAKLYPVVLLPVFGAYFMANKSYRALLHLLLGSVSAVGISLLPFIFTAPVKLVSFLTYHKQRGLQIESLPSGIIMLANKLNLVKVKTVGNYGSVNIVSSLDEIMLKVLPRLFILTYVVLVISCFYRFQEEQYKSDLVKSNSLIAYTLGALLIFIITNKVFSPQYLVWVIPFAALLRPRQAGLMLAICSITIIMSFYGHWRSMNNITVILLNIRNMLMVTLTFWIVIEHLPSSFQAGIRRYR